MKKICTCTFILLICFNIPYASSDRQDSSKNTQNKNPLLNFYEIGFNIGYNSADLGSENPDDLKSIPLNLHFGYNINNFLGLNNHPGTLQLALEPYIEQITEPKNRITTGLGAFLKYSYPLFEKISPYLEVGSGLMYFGLDTYEQGSSGLNFKSQLGGGLQYFFQEDKSFNIGYRFGHTSNAEIRDTPNGGINSHSVNVGLSLFY